MYKPYKKYSYPKESLQGFSLLELSVVLAIGAVIISSGLTLAVTSLESDRRLETQNKMEFLADTIRRFVAKFGYIPCPADASLRFSSATFGVGEGTGDSGGNPCNSVNATSGATVTGMVPVTTLGLEPNMALDGWNNRITYVIAEDLVRVGNPGNGWTGGDGNITISNEGGTAYTTTGVIALISHGENGYGAWQGSGGTQVGATSGDAFEDENADLDAALIQTIPHSTDYDDYVIYRNKWQLEP